MARTEFNFNERMLAFFLLGVGALVFMTLVFGSLWGFLWPLFIIGAGVPFLCVALHAKDRDYAWLSIPGGLTIGTGVLLFYQNTTGHWESWAYAWTLYLILLGRAFVYSGQQTGEKDILPVGQAFMFFGTIGFVLGGMFFELFIFNTFGFIGKLMIAGAMVGLGFWLLNRNNETPEKPKNDIKRKNSMEAFDQHAAQFQQVTDNVRRKAQVVVSSSDGEITPVEKQPTE